MIPWISNAIAHGGDDHGAPPPPISHANAKSVATWSREFEAVLSWTDPHPGDTSSGHLWVADYATSAPVTGSIQLALSGPGAGPVTTAAGPTGTYAVETTFTTSGDYDGSLTVLTDSRSDILGLPTFSVADPVIATPYGGGWEWIGLAVVAGLGAGLLFGLIMGWGIGRWKRVTTIIGSIFAFGTFERTFANPGSTTAGLTFPMESQFLLGLRTEIVQSGNLADEVRALGRTISRPGDAATLQSPVTGVIQWPRSWTPGSPVTAGETLATVVESLGSEQRTGFINHRSEVQLQLIEAQQALSVAERDTARASSLGGVLSEKEQLERKKALELAQQQLSRFQQLSDLTSDKTPKTTLRAPISGQIASIGARPGDLAVPGATLFRIVHDGGLWVETRIPETLAGNFEIGAAATVIADARPDEPLSAFILDPGLEADPNTGTLGVTLTIAEQSDWLKPGMTVNTRIHRGATKVALTIPDDALVESNGETIVFVKTAPEQFEVRRIQIGRHGKDRWEVTHGLTEGERVVTAATYSLRSLAGR